ncbi:DUF2796 domain-containing protein [Pseudomonas sp. RIT-PI-S]|uniref:DUF2796 domain-containing protein n=1 Tax=Pseudomonas sp. RIT-PI-S TaxID=3035295 RepID=UPI0021D91158|nr:DUF2796 domain-containing protein [Pseudomonas sp. RIT-PI-S]
MRPTLLAITLALLPVASYAATTAGQPAAEAPHVHGSLAPHEHGTARLDVALDGQTLALDLDSPGMNLVGFEHAPASDADRAAIAKARELLAAPLQLFDLPASAKCSVTRQELQSPLFGNAAPQPAEHDEGEDQDADHHAHSDVDGHFQFHCEHPEALAGLDLTRFLAAFPATHKVLVQAITPNGQAALEAEPGNSKLAF